MGGQAEKIESISNPAWDTQHVAKLACLLGGAAHVGDAHRLLDRLGGIGELCLATRHRLLRCGLGAHQVETLLAARALMLEAAATRSALTRLDRPAVVALLRPLLVPLRHEEMHAVYLTADGRLIGHEPLARGGATSVSIHLRDVLGPALEARAARLVLAHNHPSGRSMPSLEDMELTRRLSEAASVVGIGLIDHLVVAEDGVSSAMPGASSLAWSSLVTTRKVH